MRFYSSLWPYHGLVRLDCIRATLLCADPSKSFGSMDKVGYLVPTFDAKWVRVNGDVVMSMGRRIVMRWDR